MDNRTIDAVDLLIRSLLGSKPAVSALMERNGHTSPESMAYLSLGYIGVEYLDKIWCAHSVGHVVNVNDVDALLNIPPLRLCGKSWIGGDAECEVNLIRGHHAEMATGSNNAK